MALTWLVWVLLFVVTISSQLPVCTSETEVFGQPARLPLWSRAVSSAGLTPSWEGWLWPSPKSDSSQPSVEGPGPFHPRDLAFSDTPGSLTSPNRTMPASGGASKRGGSPWGSVVCPSTIISLPAGKPQTVLFINCKLSLQPPQVWEPSTSTQAASCTWAELQSPLPWLTNLYSHACLYFLKVCQAGAHRYSPVPLTHPPQVCLDGACCHFQGVGEGGE